MADFENKNNAQWNENGAAQNADNTTNNSGAANTAAPAGNAGSGVNGAANPYAYQNGYYRNATPHQDEAVHSGAYQQQNAASSAYNNPAGGQTTPTGNGGSGNNGGYSYVNYYSDPNGGDPNKKPKKKHTGLKVAAFVLAMVLVSGGSIGVYEGIRSSNADNSSSIVASNDSSAAESSTGDSSSSKKSDSSQSWIQLASTNGSMSVADIVKKVTPSVVGVQSTFSSSNGSNNNPMNGYGGFFGYGSQGNNGSQGMTGVGTGIIMSKDGYIVTNAHVIYDDEYGYGEASSVQIQMSDEETTYDARIVAYDKEADIAVLKIDADNLTPAEFGDSSSCEVGEMVVAIGNPLGLQFQNTVTCGIISALDRKVTINDNTMTLIQTDTAINNGNSGGPLINSSGQVIGINSAKMSSTYSGEATVEGIGFAIPMSEAKSIVDDLINYGYVTGRPQLGISCQDVTEAVSQAYNIPVGAYIFSVTAGGAADQAGLQPGDVITGIQDQTISTTEELNAVKNQYKAGDTITLTYVRAGETKKVDVTLAEVQQTENN
ncbi:MAG: trypsin-like peptidase domain-containing protein [Ruminococcus callidus]|uniref:S1C family serine protease n=1 Tax=Ruminococcus callidus TaxID=40519 RepID=UPI002E793770|nr:trypsin-like peptidase domain-containing protein [Ruminococcus callidus]MEE0505568.1 trypsin-like peptidase domain-containing protein [Ruminococcus callidus]